jgi:hypothetical protein
MEPHSLGRKLGIGVRAASTILRERSRGPQGPGSQPSAQPAAGIGGSANVNSVKTRGAAEKTRAVGRASKRFGEALWGPFVHVSGVLWLEITGLFFGIFALFFAQNVFRLRHAYAAGPERNKFLLYAGITAIFVYFAFSSFYRARRKGKQKARSG